jgi:3-hydroxyisobutyrate dehydrogenase
MASAVRVGFVGLGDMGGAIAGRIMDAGLEMSLWARRASALDQFSGGGFQRAYSLVDLARQADIVGVCVFSDEDVLQVVLGDGGLTAGLKPGSLVIVHSTVSVETCHELAAGLEARGVDMLDAPVTGGRVSAEAGTLAIMVGGRRDAFDRARTVFAAYSSLSLLMGPLGSGMRTKLINNALSIGNSCLASAAIETAHQFGLDVASFIKILHAGGADSKMLDVVENRLIPDPDFAAHITGTMTKDAGLFLNACTQAGIQPNPLVTICNGPIERMIPVLHS